MCHEAEDMSDSAGGDPAVFSSLFPEKILQPFNTLIFASLETIQIFTVNIDGPDVLESIHSAGNPWDWFYPVMS